MKAIPINESEAIFERFMDVYRSEFPAWQVESSPGADVRQYWCAVQARWPRGNGNRVCRMVRECAADLDGYDRLIFRLSLPSTAEITLRARVDGVEKTVIQAQKGLDDYGEYEGPISGSRIQRLEFDIIDYADSPGNSLMSWLGLANSTKREEMLARENPFLEAWQGLVLQSPLTSRPEPTLGLFFSNHDMAAIRSRAFVGLLDSDEGLLKVGVEHLLAAVHCEYWIDGPIMTLPGGTHEHRAFVAYRVASNIVCGLDWAGALLNDAGRAAAAHALATKGLPACLISLMRHDYMRDCNQGTYMAYGAILIEAALAKLWPPHGGELIDAAKRAVDETVERYLGEDGGAFGGPGYVSSTISHAIIAYQVYARNKGLSLAEAVPEKLLRSEAYFATMSSTVPPVGSSVCVADGGHPGALAGILPRIADLENIGTPGSAFNLIYGPDTLDAPAPKPPVFSLMSVTGQLCSCRQTRGGPVRIQVIGAPPLAGHAHEDKGSFIIEAYREEIAIDRGQISYNDPRCEVMSHARYHNVLLPDYEDGGPARQQNPCKVSTIPEGKGDETSLDCSLDGSGLYPELVSHWTRSIHSATATEFVASDLMIRRVSGTVSFHLQSRNPWIKTDTGWATEGKKARLDVYPEWAPMYAWGGEDFIEGHKAAAHHLILRAAPGIRHELTTRLILKPVGAGRQQ